MSEWLGVKERPVAVVRDLAGLTPAELRTLADGCTEHTCRHHGEYNRELAARGLPRHIEQGTY